MGLSYGVNALAQFGKDLLRRLSGAAVDALLDQLAQLAFSVREGVGEIYVGSQIGSPFSRG